MNKIVEYIKEKGGYAWQTELREHGFQPRDISKLFNEGIPEKVQPGLYKLTDSNITSGFVDISKAIPQAVIALASVLAYYELTTFNPSKIHLGLSLMIRSLLSLISRRLRHSISEKTSIR